MKALTLIFLILVAGRISYSQNWTQIKNTVSPTIELNSEYDSIYQQPLSVLGWEDGIHISEDGLHLYCTYVPIDFLSFVLNGDLPTNYSLNYLRGAPDYGMDLVTNPISATEWIHADILYSNRISLTDSFTNWQLSDMARAIYSEGAPATLYQEALYPVEFMLFTSIDNPTNNQDIWMIQSTFSNPYGTGSPLPAPINTTYNEDNPHLIRVEGDTLALFYDSDNLPGGMGDIDIWYSTSYDNGVSWNISTNVSSVNTASKEHQPFLFYDKAKHSYYLYYAANHTDGKLAIFRKEQLIENDWNSWGNTELVISAGNSAGIGEPTLTNNGDISFVVVYEDTELNSIYDRFDADPWYLRKKDYTLNINDSYSNEQKLLIYPNPTNGWIAIDPELNVASIKIFNNQGALYYHGFDNTIDISDFPNGIYHISIVTISGIVKHQSLIKK